MNRTILKCSHILALTLTGLLVSGFALAEKPSWAGHDNGDKHSTNNRQDGNDNRREDSHGSNDYRRDDGNDHVRHDNHTSVNVYFGDQHRSYVHEYYQQHYRRGHCPPGLAKRHNGCVPPGQERRWRMGYPIPRDVIYYDLPPRVLIELGSPPPRHRYVRVAADILLIAIGTGIVVDAIEDIGN
jgi:hypothetical protein